VTGVVIGEPKPDLVQSFLCLHWGLDASATLSSLLSCDSLELEGHICCGLEEVCMADFCFFPRSSFSDAVGRNIPCFFVEIFRCPRPSTYLQTWTRTVPDKRSGGVERMDDECVPGQAKFLVNSCGPRVLFNFSSAQRPRGLLMRPCDLWREIGR
jgi:hypothetical protein